MFKCETCNKEFNKKVALNAHTGWHKKRNGKDTLALIERNKRKKQKNQEMYYQSPLTCKQCGVIIPYEIFSERKCQIKKGSKNSFCGRSCAATYHNTHKTKGTTVSKLERWIAEKLNNIFPLLEIHYNRKDTINSELDIYIPLLMLAFELNGIFHYEPIFSLEKLKSIQNNDERKLQACLEKGIELCVIDTSKHTYVKDSTCKVYLDIVLSIINLKAARLGIEPSSFA